MTKWEPRDAIAAILLIGAFGLRALGVNSLTEYLIIGVAVSYGCVAVGARLTRPKKNDPQNDPKTLDTWDH